MAGNENRRRKKIEAKRAKRKAEQKAVARVQSSGMTAKMTLASRWPIIQTGISAGGPVQGLVSLLISRLGPNGQVAGVIFLVDTYCLGVKDIVLYHGPESEWKMRTQNSGPGGKGWDDVSPEYLRKFVEGAVAYARSLGLAPYHDWSRAIPIFGDIDASQCLTEFTYGLDGKPWYIQGPHDSPDRIRQIRAALSEHAGQSIFLGSSDGFDDEYDEYFDDDDEEHLENLETE